MVTSRADGETEVGMHDAGSLRAATQMLLRDLPFYAGLAVAGAVLFFLLQAQVCIRLWPLV